MRRTLRTRCLGPPRSRSSRPIWNRSGQGHCLCRGSSAGPCALHHPCLCRRSLGLSDGTPTARARPAPLRLPAERTASPASLSSAHCRPAPESGCEYTIPQQTGAMRTRAAAWLPLWRVYPVSARWHGRRAFVRSWLLPVPCRAGSAPGREPPRLRLFLPAVFASGSAWSARGFM